VFAHGSSMHQKCYSYALTNLLFGLCRSMWVVDLLVNFPSPHPGALACPFTPEVLQAKEHAPTPFPSIVFTFGFAVESIKELGGASFGNPLFSIYSLRSWVFIVAKSLFLFYMACLWLTSSKQWACSWLLMSFNMFSTILYLVFK
jgi:hypothetical protein